MTTPLRLRGTPSTCGDDPFWWLKRVMGSVRHLEDFLFDVITLDLESLVDRSVMASDLYLRKLRLLVKESPEAGVFGYYKPSLSAEAFQQRFVCVFALHHGGAATSSHAVPFPQPDGASSATKPTHDTHSHTSTQQQGSVTSRWTCCLFVQVATLALSPRCCCCNTASHTLLYISHTEECDGFVLAHMSCDADRCRSPDASQHTVCTTMHERWVDNWCLDTVTLRCALCRRSGAAIREVDGATVALCAASLGKGRKLGALRCCPGA